SEQITYETEVSLKYFLDYGLMEGAKEEYQGWEHAWYGNNYTRNDVCGISSSLTVFLPFRIYRIKVSHETGITMPFANNTIKVLLGCKILALPLALTYSNGYNGDLAQYGKKNSSIGLTLVLSSFDRPFFTRKN